MKSGASVQLLREQIIARVRLHGEYELPEAEIFEAFYSVVDGEDDENINRAFEEMERFAEANNFVLSINRDMIPAKAKLLVRRADGGIGRMPEFTTTNGVRIVGTHKPPASETPIDRLVITYLLPPHMRFVLALAPEGDEFRLIGLGAEGDFDPKIQPPDATDPEYAWQPPLYGMVHLVDHQGRARYDMIISTLAEWAEARVAYYADAKRNNRRYGMLGDKLQQLAYRDSSVIDPTLYAIVKCKGCSYSRAIDSWREPVRMVEPVGETAANETMYVVSSDAQKCPHCRSTFAHIVKVVTTSVGMDRITLFDNRTNGNGGS